MTTTTSVWLPSKNAARRIAGAMLRAHRSDRIELEWSEERACVEACLDRFIRPKTRRTVGLLWIHHGKTAVTAERERYDTHDATDLEILHVLSA